MGKSATLLLKYRPSDERCAEIAMHVAEELGVKSSQVHWDVSDELPPGYQVHLADQLEAHRRDTPGNPVFFTVTVLEEP